MNRDDVVEPLHREDEKCPISADTQHVPTRNLYTQWRSLPSSALSQQSISAKTKFVLPSNVCPDGHESMEDAVHSSDLESVTISADDLMDNRMLYQRAYPVAFEDNESMEDPFPFDQSGAARTYITDCQTHHSPHDPPMFEHGLVRYQPNVNDATIVQAPPDSEVGHLLRIQRILKDRSLMKTILRGMGRGFMALLVANGLYGDIMMYHHGSNQDETTIVDGSAALAASNSRENFPRRLVELGCKKAKRILKAVGLPNDETLRKGLAGVDLLIAHDSDLPTLMKELTNAGVGSGPARRIANYMYPAQAPVQASKQEVDEAKARIEKKAAASALEQTDPPLSGTATADAKDPPQPQSP